MQQKEKLAGDQLKKLERRENKLDHEFSLSSKNNKNDQNALIEKKYIAKNEKERVIKVEELIEKVNSDLHAKKHSTLGEHLNLKAELKKLEEKKNKFGTYVKLFSAVKHQAMNMAEQTMSKTTISDFKTICERLSSDHENFKKYLFKNFDLMNPDSDSLLESITKSNENVLDLEDSAYGYKLESRNIYGIKLLNMFKTNLLLLKQNNNILEQFLIYSKIYYNKSLERLIIKDECDQKVTESIEKYKNMSFYELSDFNQSNINK